MTYGSRVNLSPEARETITARYRAHPCRATAQALAEEFGCSASYVSVLSNGHSTASEPMGDDGFTTEANNGRHPPCAFRDCAGSGYYFRDDTRRSHAESVRVCGDCRGRPLDELPPVRVANEVAEAQAEIVAAVSVAGPAGRRLVELSVDLGIAVAEVARLARGAGLLVHAGAVKPRPPAPTRKAVEPPRWVPPHVPTAPAPTVKAEPKGWADPVELVEVADTPPVAEVVMDDLEPLHDPVDARDAAADLEAVLDWLADDEWLTVAWVVEHSGVPHAVVVDVLDDFVADGIAERWGLSRRYRLAQGDA